MHSNIPARLAYIGRDGAPRAIPIAFHWTGTEFVVCTPPHAAKVPALQTHPQVALTIDTTTFPPHVLLVRGRARVAVVDGVPPEYLLLTITGPGGEGKTRLALQVAADVLEDSPDGVWFVDLGPLDEPGLVAAAVGGVLGVREGEVTAARLIAAVSDKRLLVLDNFERLLSAAPLASAFLMRTPHVKMLVTSLIPLHAYGE